MSEAAVAPPATFVIFGALGDLTRRLLVPAIVNLATAGLIDAKTAILGVSYHDGDDAKLQSELDDFVEDKDGWAKVRDQVRYMKGDFTEAATYQALAERIDSNAIFYLATAPGFFGPIVDQLGAAKLLDEAKGFRRVVIEKPFGHDLASAKALNTQILAQADETQIYRIDHFLGKETVQNIMVMRFGNALMEATWNNRYIDHVQITAAETVTVGARGKFYDATGAMRDMVPNHLFQLLAMIGMEPPNSFDAEAVRTEKSKLIGAVRPVPTHDAVRGRYTHGTINDEAVPAYVDETDVDPGGSTETYVAMKLMVDTWRWSGVPFYLRTGKALTVRDTEIVIQFHDAPVALFRNTDVGELPPNRLVLQIQPNEGISLDFAAKRPGPVVDIAPVTMDFRYADQFGTIGHQTGYETLLYDVLMGDQTLYQRADQIEGGWRAIQPLLEAWQTGKPDDYAAGSAGPEAADALLHRDGRMWHPIG